MKLHTLCLAALAVLVAAVPSAVAQAPRTISVTGKGTANASPNYVILRGTISGGGDSAEDARKTFDKIRSKVEKAFTAEKAPNISVKYTGAKVKRGNAWGDEAVEGPALAPIGPDGVAIGGQGYAVAETVEFRIDFASDMEREMVTERLAKLHDQVGGLGVALGAAPNPLYAAMGLPQSFTEYGLKEPSAVRREAEKAALEDARTQAEELAELSGGKIGRVLSIEELEGGAGDDVPPQAAIMMGYAAMMANPTGSEYTSTENEPIKVQRRLRVVFELLD